MCTVSAVPRQVAANSESAEHVPFCLNPQSALFDLTLFCMCHVVCVRVLCICDARVSGPVPSRWHRVPRRPGVGRPSVKRGATFHCVELKWGSKNKRSIRILAHVRILGPAHTAGCRQARHSTGFGTHPRLRLRSPMIEPACCHQLGTRIHDG
jgi:hypothetical protein